MASLAPQPPNVGAAPLARLVDLLEELEALSAQATGALVVGTRPDPDGMVLVEGGRICWAVSRHMRGRLTDLLRAEAGPALDGEVLAGIYRRCRDEGRPLGETLVEEGLVSEDGLRSALRQHSAEALVRLAGESAGGVRWAPHRQACYDARFTYSPAEMLIEASAARAPGASREAAQFLAWLVDLGGRGAAFARIPGEARAWPLAQVDCDGAGVRAVADLGDWARGSIDIAAAMDPTSDVLAGATPGGCWAIVWRRAGIDYVVLCAEASTAACVLAKRGRSRSTGS